MDETLALTRLVFRKHRLTLILLSAAVVVGVSMFLIFAVPDQSDPRYQKMTNLVAAYSLFLTLLPAGLWAIVLFDYGAKQNLMLGASGCDHWVLRMPIKSWKIAAVPIFFKTLWVIAIWAVFIIALKSKFAGGPPLSILAGSIGIAAAGVWFMGIGWRLFSHGWWRLLALVLAGIFIYTCFASIVVSVDVEHAAPKLRHLSHVLPWVAATVTTVVYVTGVWYAIRAVTLARTQSHGIVREFAKSKSVADSQGKSRHYRSVYGAIVRHYLAKTRVWIQRSILLLAVPLVLFSVLVVGVNMAYAVVVILLFGYAGGLACVGLYHSTTTSNQSTLPDYIIAAPLSTAKIAWTRWGLALAIQISALSFCLIVFAGWALWPENRSEWWSWASAQAVALGTPGNVMSVGLRWSIAVVLISNLFFLSLINGLTWITLSGRSAWVVGFTLVLSALFLIAFGIVFNWFRRHASSWELLAESFYGYLALLPYLIACLLAIKVVLTVIAGVALRRQEMTRFSTVTRALAIWLGVTLTVAITVYLLIPDPRATLLWCLAITALTIPLASILAMPVMLKVNRCR